MGLLAIVATIGLTEHARWAEFAVSVFNIIGFEP
jgi:methylmalonyl-CoA mutase cobalamin-binding subunit